jgi:hypothetical protein
MHFWRRLMCAHQNYPLPNNLRFYRWSHPNMYLCILPLVHPHTMCRIIYSPLRMLSETMKFRITHTCLFFTHTQHPFIFTVSRVHVITHDSAWPALIRAVWRESPAQTSRKDIANIIVIVSRSFQIDNTKLFFLLSCSELYTSVK